MMSRSWKCLGAAVLAMCLAGTADAAPGDLAIGSWGYNHWQTDLPTGQTETLHPVGPRYTSIGGALVVGGSATAAPSRAFAAGVIEDAGMVKPALTMFNKKGYEENKANGAAWDFGNTLIDDTYGTAVPANVPADLQFHSAATSRIVVNGTTVQSQYFYQVVTTPSTMYVYGYNNDGTINTTFGTGGRLDIPFYSSVFEIVDIVNTGTRLVIAGSARATSTSEPDAVLVGVTYAGALDPTFGTGGKAWASIGFVDRFTSLAVDWDGKLVAVGRTRTPTTTWDVLVARFNPNGTLDTSFDGDGLVRFDFGNAARDDQGRAVYLDGSGKVTLTASLCVAGVLGCDVGVARLKANGAFDAPFAQNGRAEFDLTADGVRVSAIGTDGTRLLVAGEAYFAPDGSRSEPFLLGLLSNGSADSTYGPGGFRHYPDVTYVSAFESLTSVWRDGVRRLVAAGTRESDLTSGLRRAGLASGHWP